MGRRYCCGWGLAVLFPYGSHWCVRFRQRTCASPTHFKRSDQPLKLIEQIHKAGMKAGVAISPDTPSIAITDDVAEAADMLLVMTVYPGKHKNHWLLQIKISETSTLVL